MGKTAVVRPLDLPPGRRVLVVSDLHGNLPLFRGALRKAGFTREDILIVLGDIVERHTQSLETLQYLVGLCRTHRVYAVLGNCDNLVLSFADHRGDISDEFFRRWFSRLGERSVLVKMARLAGVDLGGPEDYPAARAAIRRQFHRELEFLRRLPQILLTEHYLFVHGGVPREDRLEELDAYGCMKNDDFLSQGHAFRRWVIVGHWPVTLYNERRQSAAPLICPDRHIISIDGGASLKWDGQVNALILPPTPGGDFTWVSEDGLPSVTALDSQDPSQDAVNIRYGHNALEVLERGAEFCRCRHLETGRELDVLTEYIEEREGRTVCEDFTDYRLPVEPGDTLSVVRETSRGLLAKKDGVTGWYFGAARP